MIKTLLLCLCMVACNDKDNSLIPSEQEYESEVSSDYTELLNKTAPVPVEYKQESTFKGRVVQIDYDTKNYVDGTEEMRRNTAYVYLPMAMMIPPINVIMCSISYTDMVKRRLLFFRMRMN